jgi:hypothetical protein
MSWSLRETQTLTIKAARGAGLSWGLAEEAGYAVHWLQAHGAPGVRAFANYLSWRDAAEAELTAVTVDPELADPNAVRCPITLGATLSDLGESAPPRLGIVRQPILLVPFIAAATPLGSRCLTWKGTEVLISRTGFSCPTADQLSEFDQVECQLSKTPNVVPPNNPTLRVPESESLSMTVLGEFAAHTYAPATDQSRAGAGSSRSDND